MYKTHISLTKSCQNKLLSMIFNTLAYSNAIRYINNKINNPHIPNIFKSDVGNITKLESSQSHVKI